MADTTLSCHACKKIFRVRNEQDGCRVRCPHCGWTITVRLPATASTPQARAASSAQAGTGPSEEGAASLADAIPLPGTGRKLPSPTIVGQNCRSSRLGKGLTIIGFLMLCMAVLAGVAALFLFLAAFSADPGQRFVENLFAVAFAQWFLYSGITLALTGLIFCGFGHNLEYLARIERLLQEQRRP